MKTVNLINVALAIIVLALLVINFIPEQNEYQPLISQAPDDLNSVQLLSRQRNLVFARENNEWILTSAPEKKLKQDVIEKLTGILRTHSYRQFENTLESRKLFQLEQPDYHIIINDIEILYGTTEPAQQLRYVLVENKIHLITDLYLQYLLAGEDFFIQTTQ